MRMKTLKRAALLLAIVMILTMLATAAFASVTGTTTSKLNKRAEPSTSAAKKGTIAKGAKVTVVDELFDGDDYDGDTVKGDWYELSDGSFVSADYVELDGSLDDGDLPLDDEELPPDDGEAPPSDEDDSITMEDNSDGVILADGDIILEDGNDDIPLDSDEDVLPDDLEDEDLPADDVQMGIVNADNLNVRSKPSTSASKAGTLNKNQTITIVNSYADGDDYNGMTVSGSWYEYETDNGTAFVASRYIALVNTNTEGADSYTVPIVAKKTTYKTTKKVTVYKLPTTVAATNGTVSSGSTVNVYKKISSGASFTGLSAKVSGDWYQIGSSKYIQAKYVTTSTSTVKSNVEVAVGSTLTTTAGVKQRAKPSTSATNLGTVAKGSTVVVVGVVLDGTVYNGALVEGNWIQIKGGGFISADYVMQ